MLPQVPHQPRVDVLGAGEALLGGDEADEEHDSRESDEQKRHL